MNEEFQTAAADSGLAIQGAINRLGLYIGSPDIYPGLPVQEPVVPAPAGRPIALAQQAALDAVAAAIAGVAALLVDMVGDPAVTPYEVPGLSLPGADVATYLGLITSEHASQPLYRAALTALLKPLSDGQGSIAGLADRFDLDRAVGDQIDTIGLWVGASRRLTVPLTGVYFSFDTAGVGFDQGSWWAVGDPTGYLTVLPDDGYRTLIRARIAANAWDGTIPGAYAVWDIAFAGTGYSVLIQDNQNMTMDFALLGPSPDAVTLALFTGGYLNVRPAGVAVNAYWTQSVPDIPYFGFDAADSGIAGFDVGAWGLPTSP
ncbi:uncharacterized protein DUF2612 [Azospirillum baldaniorum]|uniref:DUF2612 domain-containing protein n=1 Tax=Azospirillum baldaniorum TaxID=1064539 RepID=UPI00119EA799|nr:DUF2612 domain-containing protein [Azospirillum baldaniorum]TWA71931.1 uncharacterized protein DUF2612 [Azospirillum baldaniorum]